MGKVIYQRTELVTPPARTPEELRAWKEAKAARREKEKADRGAARAPQKEGDHG